MKNQIQPTKEGAMKRRIVIALALIAVLVVGSSMIGGTLAYLSTYTPEIENVFELGELKYKLHYEKGVSDELADTVTNMPDPNPAEGEIAGTEYTFESDAPVRTGYKFLGWADEPNVTEAEYLWDDEKQKYLVTVEYDPANYEDGTTTKTVYAVWEPITYTVTYNANGGENAQITGTTADSDHTYDVKKNLTENGYVRTGYTFSGWNTKPDGTGTHYDDKAEVVNLTSEDGATVTLYAQWGVKTYVLRYHANGGEGTMADQPIEYDAPTKLSKNAFTKEDHSFLGWALTPDGEAKYIDEQIVVNLLENGMLNLYAVWGQDSHTVYFDYNGGSGSPASKQFQFGKPYGQLPEYPVHPTKVISEKEVMSYLFTGWYTAPTEGKRVYPDDIANTKEDHTLYAHWEEAPTNNVIKDIVVKNNPDDDKDGVVDDVYLNLKCSSSFEKFNIPLKNLIAGQTYKITYTASNDASFGDYITGYKSSVYGSYIVATKELTGGRIDTTGTLGEDFFGMDLLATWNDRKEPDGNNDGSQAATNDSYLNGPWKNRTITFTATQSTMYWTWDFGLMEDGILNNYNITDIRLEPVAPTIDFVNKKLILHNTSKAQVLNDTSSAYATKFEFDGDGHAETMYYPITGLTAGSKYTITFDHTFSGKLIDDSVETPRYHYGCGIMNAEPTVYGSYMENIGSWASDTFVMESVTGKTESVTLTFEATGSTAYWVWNMANVSDSNNATIDVQVTKFSAKHSGGNITYYDKASQANAIGYTMTPPAFEPITVDMPGITVTGMETYATDQPLVLTLNGDADIMPDLVLVDVLVGENWTFYATGFDKDLLASYAAADGVTIAQEEWLAKNEDGSWTLTIPGEVVVSDVTIVIRGANFWSYDLYDMTIDDLSN